MLMQAALNVTVHHSITMIVQSDPVSSNQAQDLWLSSSSTHVEDISCVPVHGY